jgi:hypothetical protein
MYTLRSIFPLGGLGMTIPRRAGMPTARRTQHTSAVGGGASALPGDNHISRILKIPPPAGPAAFARGAAHRFVMSARAPHMVNVPRALFNSRTGRQARYHIGIEQMPEWTYLGERLIPLKGFPGVVWDRSKRKPRAPPIAAT